MLIYLVALSIISSCLATPSSQLDSNVRQVVLIQESPVTAYKLLREMVRIGGLSAEQTEKYLKRIAGALMDMSANRFTIKALEGLDSTNKVMTSCKDADGNAPKYSDAPMTDDLKNNLKRYWPTYLNVPDSWVWEALYENVGSCVSHSPSAYYQNAITLHDTYNVGELLRKASIHLNDRISYDNLIRALVGQLGVNPFITCGKFQTDRSDEQFLHEVHICFNTSYELMDCTYRNGNHCTHNDNIVYPPWFFVRH